MGHLFCTLISENQGLEKLRSASNLRKIRSCTTEFFFSTPEFFFCLSPDFFYVYGINLKKNSGDKLKKKIRSTEKKTQVCRT